MRPLLKSLNVLITAASRRVALVRHFQAALRDLRLPGQVIVTDVNGLSPAVHVADRAYRAPMSDAPGYLDAIAQICETEDIGLVVPTIDDELPLFGGAIARFEAMGARVAASIESTARICNDKFETCRYLRAHGVTAVESFLPGALPADPGLPLFVKPRLGRGSLGAFAARTRRELEFFLEYVPNAVVQRYLEGPEFTIDLLCDFHGRPLSVVPRERVVIRAGVIDRGRTVADRRLIDLALQCAAVLPFRGPVNIQCRMVGDEPIIFEINPRFSGGIPLTIAAGADFPRMLAELALERRVAPRIGDFRPDTWMTNHDSAIFLQAHETDALQPCVPAPRRSVA